MDTNITKGRVDVELDAMRHVAEILSALPDEQSRARVLRWAADHLTIPQAAVAPGVPSHDPTAASARDARPKPVEFVDTSDLNLEGLESLFEGDGAAEKANDQAVGAETGRASRSAARTFERNRSRNSSQSA